MMKMNSYNNKTGIYMLDLMWNECLISMEDFVIMHALLSELHWEAYRELHSGKITLAEFEVM